MWSGPCVAMDLLFTALTKEFPEQFIFAQVDIDEQPELKETHKIENVPTLMVFKDGKLARNEVGELKEKEARALLKDFGIFYQSDLIREQAREKHLADDTPATMLQLAEAMRAEPSNVNVAMDMDRYLSTLESLSRRMDFMSVCPKRAGKQRWVRH